MVNDKNKEETKDSQNLKDTEEMKEALKKNIDQEVERGKMLDSAKNDAEDLEKASKGYKDKTADLLKRFQ